MRGGGQIICFAERLGSLLSTFLVIWMIALSPATAADTHKVPRQVVATVVSSQSQTLSNCHYAASCAEYLAMTNIAVVAVDAAQSLRYMPPQAVFLTAFIPLSDTPPPRV